MKTRVAIIGLGKMGLLHSSLINIMPDAELVAICEKKLFTRHFIASMFNKKVSFLSSVGGLKTLGVDAVMVCTPVGSHYPIIKELYSNNITSNIFVEKPLSANYIQSAELVRLAKDHGGIGFVGYNRHFGVTFTRAKQMYEEGVIGEIRKIGGFAYTSDFYGARRGINGDVRGGVMRDLGCHALDLLLWIAGGFTVKKATMKTIVSIAVDDTVFFNTETENGVEIEFKSSWCEPGYRMPEIGLEMQGTKGKLRVDDDKLTLIQDHNDSVNYYRHDLQDNVPFFLGNSEYYREDAAFLSAVKDGSVFECTYSSAASVDKTMDAIELQAKR